MQEFHRPMCPETSAALLSSQLIEQWEWTRALARRLVRDPHDAEDAAQEAWLLARGTGSGGRDQEVHRGFFGSILRNVIRADVRAGRNRRARQGEVVQQAHVHRAEAQSPDELVAAAEMGRRLCEAVLELPDLYRDAVLQRYFQGLSTHQMAQQGSPGGVSEATIRSRVKRGLDMLRDRFESDASPKRRGELACLAALPAGQASLSRSAAGGIQASAPWAHARYVDPRLLFGLGAAVLGALVVGLLALQRTTAATPEAPPPATQAMLASIELLRTGPPEVGARVSATASDLPRPEEVQLFEVSGTVVDGHRKAIVGAEVTLRGGAFSGDGARDHVLRVKSDAQGFFRLSTPLSQGGSGRLVVNAGPLFSGRAFSFGHYGLGIHRPPSEGRRPLGEILMSPRGHVVARLVDGAGQLLSGVDVSLVGSSGGAAFDTTSNGEGLVTFPGMRNGDYVMRALDPAYGPGALARVTVCAGGVSDVGDITLQEQASGDGDVIFEVMDHNESDIDGSPRSQHAFRGHVLRRGQPVAGMDVTAVPIVGQDEVREPVAMGALPAEQWLDRLAYLGSQRSRVIRAVTDDTGRFVLRGAVPDTAYRIVAWGEDDHAVFQPAVALGQGNGPDGDSAEEVTASVGALHLAPYATVEIRIQGAGGLGRSEFEVARSELDSFHLVGADASGTVRMERVIAGPQMVWLQPIVGRFSEHCRVPFHARSGESLLLDVNASPFALISVNISLVGLSGPSPGFRALLRPAGDGPLTFESESAGPAASARTWLMAKPGTWSAAALSRAMGPTVLDVLVRGRRIRRPFPDLDPGGALSVPGGGLSAFVPLDGGAELRLELPEAVEFLSQGVVEFLGPDTAWSVRVVDGEFVDPPFGVEVAAPAVLHVALLGPGMGRFSVRVRDTESHDSPWDPVGGAVVAERGPPRGRGEGDEGLLVFEGDSSRSLRKGEVSVWCLR